MNCLRFPSCALMAGLTFLVFESSAFPVSAASRVTTVKVRSGQQERTYSIQHGGPAGQPGTASEMSISPNSAFFLLPSGYIPLQASGNGVVLMRNEEHYFRWRAGTLTQLDVFLPIDNQESGGPESYSVYTESTAFRMNSRGDIAIATYKDQVTVHGVSSMSENTDHTVTVWQADSEIPRELELPSVSYNYQWDCWIPVSGSARFGVLESIDDAGRVWLRAAVGLQSDGCGNTPRMGLVAVNPDGSLSSTPLQGSFSVGGINRHGVFAGSVSPDDGGNRIGYIGTQEVGFHPFAINSAGVVVGGDYRSAENRFVWHPDGHVEPGPTDGIVESIDDNGRLHGYYLAFGGSFVRHPVVWTQTNDGTGSYQRASYEPLVLPDGWTTDVLVPPGRFDPQVGYATDGSGQTRPFLFMQLRLRLLVDANRDGVIDVEGTSDETTPENPFRFWINDDDDDGPIGGNDIPGQIVVPTPRGIPYGPDFATEASAQGGGNGRVDGSSDLVDFFPVFLDLRKLLDVLPLGESTRVNLKNADGALNFVLANKTSDEAFGYLRSIETTGFGLNLDEAPESATTHRITPLGVTLSAAFLDGIRSGDRGLILVEGRRSTVAPLVLEIENEGGTVAQVGLDIAIRPVETMFRHVDLTNAPKNYDGSSPELPERAEETRVGDPEGLPDEPENGKWFVFVHGYNVDGQSARGWHAEIFKRMYQLGSKARFVGVSWHGATGLDYHKAVFHAFQTGDALGDSLGFLDGADVTIAAHSLGNMVVSQAIRSGDFAPARYYMINAAVPIEAYEAESVGTQQKEAMTQANWKGIGDHAFSANWHRLFETEVNDNRRWLGWRNCFIRVRTSVEVHNFFSPGEDVVEDPVSDSPYVVLDMLLNWSTSKGAWGHQEMIKGSSALGSLAFDRVQGGWGLNPERFKTVTGPDGTIHYQPLSAEEIAEIPLPSLTTEPVFRRFLEDELFEENSENASATAGDVTLQYDLLARALPAISYAVAANRIDAFDQAIPSRNFDMEIDGRTGDGWPTDGHSGSNAGRWLHSDFKTVALPYVFPMFEAMIAKGSLR